MDHERAAEALQALLELDPEHQDAARELSRHFRALDRYEALAALYQRQASSGKAERQVESGLLLGRVLSENLKQPDRAIAAYERVLELAPSHATALDALATLRAVVGDAQSALAAIDELSEKATTAEAKAELELRAAQVLEGRGDAAGALRRYKLAAELRPDDPAARESAWSKSTSSTATTPRPWSFWKRRSNSPRTSVSAPSWPARCRSSVTNICRIRGAPWPRRSLRCTSIRPTATRCASSATRRHAEQRYVEAAKRLEPVLGQLDTVSAEEAREIAFLYIDSLAQSGSTEKALNQVGGLMTWFEQDPHALLRIAQIAAEHGSAEQTLWLCELLLGEMRPPLVAEGRIGGRAAQRRGARQARSQRGSARFVDARGRAGSERHGAAPSPVGGVGRGGQAGTADGHPVPRASSRCPRATGRSRSCWKWATSPRASSAIPSTRARATCSRSASAPATAGF